MRGKLDVGGFASSCSTLLISRVSYLFICFSFLVQRSSFAGPQPVRSLGSLVLWTPASLLVQIAACRGLGFCVFFLGAFSINTIFFLFIIIIFFNVLKALLVS